MSAALAEVDFTYSPSPSEKARVFSVDTTRSRRDLEWVPVEPSSRTRASGTTDPQPERVQNYIVREGEFIGRTSEGRMVVARRRFRVSVEQYRRDGFLVVLQADQSRVGSGNTLPEAWHDFSESLVEDYEFYGRTEDADLTEDAQEYKRLLQQLLVEA